MNGQYVAGAAATGVALVTAPILLLTAVTGAQGAVNSIEAPSVLREGTVPEPYRALITKAATTCRAITAPVLAAQIHAESNWNPTAVSPSGAVGMSQFMPGTWAEVGVDGDGDGRAEATSPADAIATQAVYMCGLVTQVRRAKLNGDVLDLSLAAYNAGFGAVQQYRGIPPYPETKDYVRKIRGLIGKYAADTGTAVGAAGPGVWVHPVGRGPVRLTSPFGPRWGKPHTGVDFGAPVGTAIYAASDGVVAAAGPSGGRNAWAGRWVRIRHAGGVETLYAHISSWRVRVNQRVTAGQLIAAVGNEGNSTGPHLHIELHVAGKAVDPVEFYSAHGVSLVRRARTGG